MVPRNYCNGMVERPIHRTRLSCTMGRKLVWRIILILTGTLTTIKPSFFRFMLSRTLGVVSFAIYLVFLTISILFEMNVFFDVNPPMCNSEKYS